MKRFIVLAILMTLATAAFAQVSTTNPRIIDSTGTAVASHWQEVDFLSSAVRNITFLNKSTTIALILALRAEDTVASATRYQIQLGAGRTFILGTTQPKVYVKAASGTAAYSVSNGLTGGVGSDATVVDTLSARLPASKPRTLLDSLKTTNVTQTAHAAGDEFSSATTSPGTRGFSGAVLTTGGQAWLDQLVAWTDSLITTTIEVSWYTDSVASNNDNAAFQTLIAAASKFLGSTVIQLNPGGAGSTVSTGRVYGDLLKVSSTTTKLWYRVKVLTATTFKHQGGIFLKPTFKYF